MYKSHGWELAENHILYTLGHQSLLLKDHYTAASLFNELVATTNMGLNPLQQMCHLREFFIVHHMREKEDKSTATITIPFFKAEESVLDLSGNQEPQELLVDQVKGTLKQCGKLRISVTQILREINFGGSRNSKTAVFAICRTVNFVDLVNSSIQKVQNFIKIKIQSL